MMALRITRLRRRFALTEAQAIVLARLVWGD